MAFTSRSINPYQPVAGVADARLASGYSTSLEWAGRHIAISAEQMPQTLWLIARVQVTIDEIHVRHVVKWRWRKRATWTFQHEGNQSEMTLECRGANQFHCRLLVDGTATGESIVPVKGFWVGVLVSLAIAAIMLGGISWFSALR